MTYLLDTHVFLWLQTDPGRIDAELLADLGRADELLLSAASSWEIGIKHRLGKLPLPGPPPVWLPDRLVRSGVTALPVEISHTLAASQLPLHHRDPFDRLLVAQAQLLAVPLVTADSKLEPYDVEIVHV